MFSYVKKSFATLAVFYSLFVYADLASIQKESKGKVDAIESIYTRLEVQMSKAQNQNDIRQVNCILTKLNLVKGLLKASQRASLVLTKAYVDNQGKTVDMYKKRVTDYHDSAATLESSMDECLPERRGDAAATMVFIRPEGDSALAFGDTSPFAWSYETPGTFPVIPPASPFR